MRQLLIGSTLLIATTVVHAMVTALVLLGARRLHPERWSGRRIWAKTGLVAALVLLLFFAAVVEVALWAITYMRVGALEGFEKALYFSMVTFTTLGYGEIVLTKPWRLLASFEAATGIIIFGWTTAILVAVLNRVTREQQAPAGRGPERHEG